MFLKILQFQIQSPCTTTGTIPDPFKDFSLNSPQTLCHRIIISILHTDTLRLREVQSLAKVTKRVRGWIELQSSGFRVRALSITACSKFIFFFGIMFLLLSFNSSNIPQSYHFLNKYEKGKILKTEGRTSK